MVEEKIHAPTVELPSGPEVRELLDKRIAQQPKAQTEKQMILKVDNLKMYFPVTRGLLKRKVADVKAVDDVSFGIVRGETLGIVGESGSGKSTIGNCVMGNCKITGGHIMFDGIELERQSTRELRKIHKNLTMITQDPYASLDPRKTISEIILEGPRIHKLFSSKGEARDIVGQMLELVGLNPKFANRYPHEFSGGQQQRVGIARAFAANPPIVLMDEPFSALDPMTRAELQNEIHDLQTKAQKTVVFVTHDMDEAIKLADRICIIQDGKVAQCDTPENILKHPANQYVTEFIGANRLWANPEYIRAADIMRRRPFTISKGRTVIQALQIMRHNSVDSLLVLDKGQTLLGVVWLEELIGKREADPIEYYISDDYIAVEGETSLKEIIATIDYDVSGIIPVIQHDRKLLGYLTKSIILATMSKQFVPEHTAGERSGVICPATL